MQGSLPLARNVYECIIPPSLCFPFVQQASHPTWGTFLLPQFPLLLFLLNCSYPLLVLPLSSFVLCWHHPVHGSAMTYIHDFLRKIYCSFSLDLSPSPDLVVLLFWSIFIRCSVSFLNLTWWEHNWRYILLPAALLGAASAGLQPSSCLSYKLLASLIFIFSRNPMSSLVKMSLFPSKTDPTLDMGEERGKTDGKGTRSALWVQKLLYVLGRVWFHGYKHLSKWIRLCVEDMCLTVGKLHLSKQWQKRCLSWEHCSPSPQAQLYTGDHCFPLWSLSNLPKYLLFKA